MLLDAWKFFRLRAEKIPFKWSIKTGVAATLAMLFGQAFAHLTSRPNNLLSGAWCVFTAIIVLQEHLGKTYKEARNRFLGLIVGSFMGGLFTHILGADAFSLGSSVFLTGLLCYALGIQENFRIASLSVGSVILLWGLQPETSPWVFAFFRLIDSVLGIIIAMAVAHTLWPFHAAEKLRHQAASSVRRLEALYQAVFFEKEAKILDDLLQQADESLYDSRLALEESRPERELGEEKIERWASLINDLDRLLEAILSLQNAYSEKIKNMSDLDLQTHTQAAIEQARLAFALIAQKAEDGKSNLCPQELRAKNRSLQEDLIRFRSTKTTRRFNFSEAENFFVFFYALKNILDLLVRIEEKIEDLTISSSPL